MNRAASSFLLFSSLEEADPGNDLRQLLRVAVDFQAAQLGRPHHREAGETVVRGVGR
jgi:hypothetical protein